MSIDVRNLDRHTRACQGYPQQRPHDLTSFVGAAMSFANPMNFCSFLLQMLSLTFALLLLYRFLQPFITFWYGVLSFYDLASGVAKFVVSSGEEAPVNQTAQILSFAKQVKENLQSLQG